VRLAYASRRQSERRPDHSRRRCREPSASANDDLTEQGIQVDVSARGEVTCDLSGCEGSGSASACSAAPAPAKGAAGLVQTLVVLSVGLLGCRRRRRR